MRGVRCGVVWILLFSYGLASMGHADTISETDSYSAGVTTRFPLPFPSGTVATMFTSYTGTAFPYILGTFYVGTSGSFSGAVSGIGGGVGLYIIRGTFAPASGTDPATLLSDVLAGTQAPATIPSVSLVEGQEYSYLIVVSAGSGTGTITLSGDGCIQFDMACATDPDPMDPDPMDPDPMDPEPPIILFVPVSTGVTGGVAAMLDSLSMSASGDLALAIGALGALSSSEQQSALERLVPVPAQVFVLSTRAAMTGAFDRVSTRLDTLRVAERWGTEPNDALLHGIPGLASVDASFRDPARSRRLWLTSYGLAGRQGDDGQFAGYRSHGWGATFGADRELRPGLIGGFGLSYSDTALSYHNQRAGDRSGVKSTQLSLYGSRELSFGYVEGMFAYSQQRYDSRRNTTVSGIANGDFDGAQWGARLATGAPLGLDGNVDITPKASLDWSHVRQESYTESTGGPLALHVDATVARRWRTSLGVEINGNTELGQMAIQPYARTFWHRDLTSSGVGSKANFVGTNALFTAPGQALERDTYSMGAGVKLFASDRISASLGYDATLGKDYRAHALEVSARWEF